MLRAADVQEAAEAREDEAREGEAMGGEAKVKEGEVRESCSAGRRELRRSHRLGCDRPVGMEGRAPPEGWLSMWSPCRGEIEKSLVSLLRRGARPTEPQSWAGWRRAGQIRVRSAQCARYASRLYCSLVTRFI